MIASLVRNNYGCTHFIVGRDHAGVGNYYGTYDARDMLENLPKEDLAIIPLFFDNNFLFKHFGSMVSSKTCPYDEETRATLIGTQVRRMLQRGETTPPEFTRPAVAAVLVANN